MKRFILPVVLGSALIFAACGSEEEETEESSEEAVEVKETEEVEEVCTYAFNAENTEIKWIAFKHGTKAPVPGIFEKVEFEGNMEGETAFDIMFGMRAKISTESVYSGDADRDPKLVEHFFLKMASGETISASITDVNESTSECKIEIEMNENVHEVMGQYTITDNVIEIKASINMFDWGAEEAHASINKACEEKHTGPDDSEAVTWPDVDLVITSTLDKVCE